MAIIYNTVTDHINKHMYPLSVPAYYMRQFDIIESGKDIDKLGPMWPIFDNCGGAMNMTYSRLPIANMIEMLATKVQFRIIDDKDIVSILSYLNRYIAESRMEIEQNSTNSEHPLVKYIIKAAALQKWIDRLYRICLNTNPGWRELLEPEPEGLLKVMKLLNKMAPVPPIGEIPPPVKQPDTVSKEYLEMLSSLNRPVRMYDV